MSNTPLFQHRHYTKMADIIASLPSDLRPWAAKHFAESLKGTNPQFSAERFEAAANGKPINGRDKVR